MISNRVRNDLEWVAVAAVSLGMIAFGFFSGKKLSENSWVDLNLPACAPVEIVKKVNMGGACNMDSFDIGSVIEYRDRVLVLIDKSFYSWKKDGPEGARELKLLFKERKSERK